MTADSRNGPPTDPTPGGDDRDAAPLPTDQERRPARRSWIWYFGILVVLAAAAIIIQIVVNLHWQLQPAQVAEARALWQAHGPRSYDLEYLIKKDGTTEKYQVHVRQGQVVAVTRDGQPLGPRFYRYHSMPGLFDNLDGFLNRDAQPGSPRAYNKALFDPVDGHLKHYVRSVSHGERLEMAVQLTPLTEESEPAKKAD